MLAGCGEATRIEGTRSFRSPERSPSAVKKVAEARLTLHPQGTPAASPAEIAVGTTKADGTFAVTIYDEPKGIPAGEYVGTVEYYKPVDGGTGPNVIPKTYVQPGDVADQGFRSRTRRSRSSRSTSRNDFSVRTGSEPASVLVQGRRVAAGCFATEGERPCVCCCR